MTISFRDRIGPPLAFRCLDLSQISRCELVVLVPTDATDVVPGVGLVAEIALLDAGVVLAGHHHRDHVEMAHIVTGRRLMALRTFDGTGRRVLEARDLPGRRQMAGHAFAAEEIAMRTAIAVAGKAVEACHALDLRPVRQPMKRRRFLW